MIKLKKFFKVENGQGLVEFAMVLPIFIFIVFTIIDFSWIAYQRSSFNYGYLKASCEITADDLGDTDELEDVRSESTYSGSKVSDNIKESIIESNDGILDGNLTIKDAVAKLYNEKDDFSIPDYKNRKTVANSITRYMDLTANLEYEIRPITFIGKTIFGDSITVKKELVRTNVIKSHHRT